MPPPFFWTTPADPAAGCRPLAVKGAGQDPADPAAHKNSKGNTPKEVTI